MNLFIRPDIDQIADDFTHVHVMRPLVCDQRAVAEWAYLGADIVEVEGHSDAAQNNPGTGVNRPRVRRQSDAQGGCAGRWFRHAARSRCCSARDSLSMVLTPGLGMCQLANLTSHE